jgi:dynein heavy chain 1
MTATRQFIAQRNSWSLEELSLNIEKYSNQRIDDESFLITGLRIEGGNWSDSNEIKPIGEKE